MIETARLLLRPWKPDDRAHITAHLNTHGVMRWIGALQTAEEVDAMYERVTLAQAKHGFSFWAVERREDAEFLGICGLKIANARNCPVADEIEVGWRFREDSWGKGYAREAAAASLAFAFDELSAPRVVAFTVRQNEASWGLMRRLGMTERVEYAFDDPDYSAELNPTVVYVIEAETWRSQTS
jgi:RimJ/RimL family protein N-acetyltransferase